MVAQMLPVSPWSARRLPLTAHWQVALWRSVYQLTGWWSTSSSSIDCWDFQGRWRIYRLVHKVSIIESWMFYKHNLRKARNHVKHTSKSRHSPVCNCIVTALRPSVLSRSVLCRKPNFVGMCSLEFGVLHCRSSPVESVRMETIKVRMLARSRKDNYATFLQANWHGMVWCGKKG